MIATFFLITTSLFAITSTTSTINIHLKEDANRFFSQDILRGMYGRIFEYTEIATSDPCPQRIIHYSRGFRNSASSSWLVPHNSIQQDGYKCTDSKVLLLRDFNRNTTIRTRFHPEFPIRHRIARQTFRILRNHSTGFWMGVDARKCGRFLLPFPTYIFFVREPTNPIKTPFRVSLSPRAKYLFIISKSFTCIYGDAGNHQSPPPRESGSSLKPSFIPDSPEPDEKDIVSDDDVDVEVSSYPSPLHTHSVSPSVSFPIKSPSVIGNAGQALCFPAHATVRLSNGVEKRMEDIQIGEIVYSGHQTTSMIYTFSHYEPSIHAEFVTISTRCNTTISLTSGHLLYVNGALKLAGSVQLGDTLTLADQSTCVVKNIANEWKRGLFNPHSLTGDLVVNDVLTSSYTSIMPTRTAHGLLTPVRGLSLLLGKAAIDVPILPRGILLYIWFVVLKLRYLQRYFSDLELYHF